MQGGGGQREGYKRLLKSDKLCTHKVPGILSTVTQSWDTARTSNRRRRANVTST